MKVYLLLWTPWESLRDSQGTTNHTLKTTVLQEPKSQPTLLKGWSADQQFHNMGFTWKPVKKCGNSGPT